MTRVWPRGAATLLVGLWALFGAYQVGARPKRRPCREDPACALAASRARDADWVRFEAARELFERLAAGETPSQEERETIRGFLGAEDEEVIAVAAWAAVKSADRGAATLMARRLRRGREDPDFEFGLAAAMLRVGQVRLRHLPRAEALRLWESWLLRDRNSFVRAEAAKEIVALRHPQAFELLRRVLREIETRNEGSGRDAVLSVVAAALGQLGRSQAIPELRGLLGATGAVPGHFVRILELERSGRLLRGRWLDDVPVYYLVAFHARRALAQLGEHQEP